MFSSIIKFNKDVMLAEIKMQCVQNIKDHESQI